MKNFFGALWSLIVLGAVALWLGWIELPHPVSDLVAGFLESPEDRAVTALRPADQQAFISAIDSASRNFRAAKNDLAKGATRSERASALCELKPDAGLAEWVGTVKELTTNNDGLGVIAVSIAPNLTLKTWNNALSDIGSGTLVPAGSPVFQAAIKMKEGQAVRFSGFLVKVDDGDCFNEASMTIRGSMTEPEFITKFTSFSAL